MRTELAQDTEALRGLLVHEPAGVLRHERIPFVSYPYEWTFSMLKDAALAPAGPAARRARPGHRPEGLHALQRAVPGLAPGVRGHRLLRAPARGRAVDRLPPVLHALPLPAAAPVAQGRAVPPVAARLDRRHHGRRRCGRCCRSGTASTVGCSRTSSSTHGSRSATPTARRRSRTRSSGSGLKKEILLANVRKMRKLVSAARLEPARGRLDRLRRAQLLHGLGRAAQGRVRSRRGQLPSLGPRLGHRGEQRPLLADRGRGRVHRGGRRRRPGTRWSSSTATSGARATRRSSR